MDRVCIIGAGSSGIAACQVLHARGIPYDCFEAGSEVGGNWRYLNDNGMSSSYRSLHINSSRQSMQYASYPMPEDWPTYLSHRQIIRYFDDYVDHFGFRDRIRFRTRVVRVAPAPGDTWDVTVSARSGAETTHRYGAVLVANGHHWDPRYPDPYPGIETFTGEQFHSHDYKTPDRLAGKRVVVVGIGNSACDIAVEGSQVADRMYLSVRRGAHVVPKYLFGIPTDHITLVGASRLPFWTQLLAFRVMLRMVRGDVTRYGLPRPDHDVLSAHPTVSDTLLSRLGHGDITVRPPIERIDGTKVSFVDGSVDEVDVIVYGTGYHISFPFFEGELVRVTDNHVGMYRRVVPPDHRNLYFIGLVQPIGAIMPLAEAQSEWVADILDGSAVLPPAEDMRREIAAHRVALAKRYVPTHRHTIQVDFAEYLRSIRKERQISARARRGTAAHHRS
jgi:dimethylaniline monooxygenase (N-oxide forming)